MPILKRPRKSLIDLRLDLVWGAWAELGVAGWPRTHEDWAIDPEVLILHTAALRDNDPRLGDEATDWCVRYWRYVSGARLRNLLRDESSEVRASFGEFAATVNAHAGVKWPGATRARPYKVTGKSTLPSLDHPSLVWLRLRAMFGIGARTEILRHFLCYNFGGYSIASLAASAGYAKRNIAEECESLERAGVLSVKRASNRFYYSLARRQELTAFVGTQPGVIPQWTSLLLVVDALVALDETAAKSPAPVVAVEARKTLGNLGEALDDLSLDNPPEPPRGESIWPPMEEWANNLLSSWANGRWPNPEKHRLVPLDLKGKEHGA